MSSSIWKVEHFSPASELLPLPGVFAGHLQEACFHPPLSQSVESGSSTFGAASPSGG